MKIQFEHYGKKYTIETENDDVGTEEMTDHVFGLLLSAGYPVQALASDFFQKGNEVLENL